MNTIDDINTFASNIFKALPNDHKQNKLFSNNIEIYLLYPALKEQILNNIEISFFWEKETKNVFYRVMSVINNDLYLHSHQKIRIFRLCLLNKSYSKLKEQLSIMFENDLI